MKKNVLKLCYFGTYDRDYTSNKLFMTGLKENGVIINEVNAHIPVTRLDKATDMSWWHIARRIFQKYQIIPATIKKWRVVKDSDALYVGYPGHFDVFIAFIVAKLAHKKLVFNPLLSIYIGFAEEQGILKKGSLLGKAVKFFESLAYACCDLVFADTLLQKEFFQNEFGIPESKLRIAAIGADDTHYRYTEYTNTKKKINVVYYGLFSPIHGLEYLVDAAEKLIDDTDIHFTLVGNGNTFSKIYGLAQEKNLANMTFNYDKTAKEQQTIIEKADVFLGFLANHPTVHRVVPNKVYQGLALNKVVLTADAPVTRRTFKHKENMFLINPADSDALVAALTVLKNEPALRKKIATNGYQLFMTNYTPRAVGKKIIEAIEEII